MTQASKDLVRQLFEEIFNKQNFSLCDETVSAEYVEHALAPFGQTEPGKVNGPTHIRGVVTWLADQFPDGHMTIEAILAEDDMVVCRVLTEGTNLGKLNGIIPPTGKRFSARQTHWFRVEDGKLAEHWAVRDDLTTMMQLGVLQPASPPPG